MANVFGGLPLYANGRGRIIVSAVVGSLALALLGTVLHGRPLSKIRLLAVSLIVLCSALLVAPSIGLLLLGAAFHNTPTELRYLSFGVPFIALLVAWSIAPGGCPRAPGWNGHC